MPIFRNPMETNNRIMQSIIPLVMRRKQDQDELAYKDKILKLKEDELKAEATKRADKWNQELQKTKVKTLVDLVKEADKSGDEKGMQTLGPQLESITNINLPKERLEGPADQFGNVPLRYLVNPQKKGMTTAELTQRAINGDQEAKHILDEMARRKKETATAGKTDVEVINKIGESSMAQLGKEMAKDLVSQRKDVEGAVSGLQNLQEAKKLINAGMITGTGAEFLTNMGNFLSSRLGVEFDSDPIANTQAYAATMGTQVGQIIKQFGSGTGLSDADREYAEKIVGGKITLNEKAIRKLMTINEKAFKNVIKRYNQKANKVMTKKGSESLPYDLRIPYEEPKATKEISERRRTPDGKIIVKYKDGSFGYE